MEKILKRVVFSGVVLLVLGTLVGCFAKKETRVFKQEVASMMETEMVFECSGNVVTENTIRITIFYDVFGVRSEEEAEEQFSDELEEEVCDGYTIEIDYQKDRVVKTAIIDYKKVDLVEFAALQGVEEELAEQGGKNAYVSMGKVEKTLLGRGFEEVIE
ncbi:uncharacterized lipoprotein YehR (DUF1307 family) [Enterococcus sp. PF1-24]|uniref:DUF1307 domain-containing protein n=1 Tax=unclassified Enterococcus TaxID=2608891 RepID=UPI002474AD38|nr:MULTISPECIES: DUF1307 domain-containing protein [unclassified Enterococcus]MDH6365031.1 uncharacterized lipoprotein YehR (DUF1307 family) [Enterococcus sp. PFB1-1]MDH6402196.1 uncharacterized lipoprotein YehR (DUF1307 family) [Enterococcus sp. PF1-24]